MPSQADLALMQRTLARLSARARGDLMAMLRGFDLSASDLYSLKAEMGPAWVELIGTYGEASAAFGADMFEAMADELGVRPHVKLVRPVDEERAVARLGWALSTADKVGNLSVLLDELVKQPARSTVMASAHLSGGAYARVPVGDTCAFCIMLGSRGAVYKSSRSAGDKTRRYHGDCNCQVVFVRDDEDYPDGYDPDALYQQYQDARSKADSGKTGDILSAMRQQGASH